MPDLLELCSQARVGFIDKRCDHCDNLNRWKFKNVIDFTNIKIMIKVLNLKDSVCKW